MDETALADEVRRLTDEKQALREALADVIFAAVLHPELPGLELVSGAVLDRARLFIKNDSDMAAAAERARAATAAKRAALGGDATLDGWRAQRGLDALIEEAE